MKVSVDIKGLDKTVKNLNALGKEGRKALEGAINVTASELQGNARRFAPVDTGALRQNIQKIRVTPLQYLVATLERYSAYVEFGTGGLVEVPKVFKDVALTWKGRGIKKINLPARPFMHPAFLIASKNFPRDLKERLKKLVKKYG